MVPILLAPGLHWALYLLCLGLTLLARGRKAPAWAIPGGIVFSLWFLLRLASGADLEQLVTMTLLPAALALGQLGGDRDGL